MKGLVMNTSKKTILAVVVLGSLIGSLAWAQRAPDNEGWSREYGRGAGYGWGRGQGRRLKEIQPQQVIDEEK